MNSHGAFVDATEEARRHIRQSAILQECIRPRTYRLARRARPLFHLPFLLERVYVRGYEHMPAFAEPAPILAFAHKKVHDVCTVTEFMIARPLERFHNLTLVAQGGLFNGIYPWRDLMPGFIQRGFLRRPGGSLARLMGRGLDFLMRAVNANPVFREGSDLPASVEAYDAPAFSGELIMGMPYKDFIKYANRATLASVITSQREMEEMNRTFLIFPEGIYMHDGAVSHTQDLAGVAAFRKQRKTHFISLTYDELCPDRRRRINAWLDIAPLSAAPPTREDIGAFLEQGRSLLQNNSIILASHLIALALTDFRHRESFEKRELLERFQVLADRTVRSEYLFDPGLRDPGYRMERWKRFLRYKRKWFRVRGEKFFPQQARMARFAESERTVDDIQWNCNNIRHAWDYLLMPTDGE